MAFMSHRHLFWLGTLPPLMGLAADTPNELQLPKLPDFFFFVDSRSLQIQLPLPSTFLLACKD